MAGTGLYRLEITPQITDAAPVNQPGERYKHFEVEIQNNSPALLAFRLFRAVPVVKTFTSNKFIIVIISVIIVYTTPLNEAHRRLKVRLHRLDLTRRRVGQNQCKSSLRLYEANF